MLETVKRIFGEGFRVFFLAAGVYGLFTGVVWALWILAQANGGSDSTPSYAMMPQMWHAHEMIFGYAGAALGGFFLTAVPNWTGTPAARSVYLSIVAGIWILGRVVMWYSGALPAGLVAAIELAFIPVLAAKIASQLIKRPKPQNMMFLGILLLLWLSDLMIHLEWLGLTDSGEAIGLRAGLFAICAMIAVLGGRITPAFTRNAMKREGVAEADWPLSFPKIERASLILALLLPVLVLIRMPDAISGLVAILFGLVQMLRLRRWGGVWALRQPILFALHLGLGLMALGLVVWGVAGLGLGSEVPAVHLLGIGGVGTMTVAVMSRASLGHTGRPLVAPGPVVVAYGLMALAALVRWSGAVVFVDYYDLTMLLAIFMWISCFGLYLLALWPILSAPRLGRDG